MSRHSFLGRIAFCCFVASSIGLSRGATAFEDTIRVADFKSLQAALEQLQGRRAGGDSAPVIIDIVPSQMFIPQTIHLDERLVGGGLTLRGADQSTTSWLSGAVELRLSGSDDSVWRFRLPAGWQRYGIPRQLLVDRQLSAPARHPNHQPARIEQPLPDRRSGFTVPADTFPSGFESDTTRSDLVFLHDWSTSRLPIAAYDSATRTLTSLGPIGCDAPHYAIDHFEKQPRFWVEGGKSLADAPGEWWIDQASEDVVMLKIAGRDPPQVELPVLETLLHIASSSGESVHKLSLTGLGFRGSRFPMPTGGIAEAQATMHEPRDASGKRMTSHRPMMSAAVQLTSMDGARVWRCRFEGLGNTALWIGSQSRNCAVIDCDFSDIGGNAINIGEDSSRRIGAETWYKAAPDQVPTNNRVTHCRISQCGRVLPGSVAIWAALNRSLVVEENIINNLPYTGISLGWVWNDSQTPAANNVIRGNRIEQVMQLLSDGGGIYTLGRQPGTLIENNEISGVPHAAGRAESNGMFLDEGTTGLIIRQNTIRDVAQSPLRFHRAGMNSVINNSWELPTPETPAVRFNNTPEANIQRQGNQILLSQ